VQSVDDSYWALFGSKEYGFYDYWVAQSEDLKQWTTYFTGLRIHDEYKAHFIVRPSYIQIEILENPKIIHIISIDSLMRDTDGDGLTDMAEQRLCTNPLDEDTDYDGVSDLTDINPLAIKKEILTDRDKIAKLVFEYYLSNADERSAIIIALPDHEDKNEFAYAHGKVICLTYDEHEKFREKWDWYGIVSLSALFEVKKPLTTVKFSYVVGYWKAFNSKIICENQYDGSWTIKEFRDPLEDYFEKK
jgi:hypothetical protein